MAVSQKAALLEVMAAAWAELERAVAAAGDRFDVPGDDGWRPQDSVAHIAVWERMAARKIAGTPLPEGEEIAAREPWDLDAFNDAMVARWRPRSADEVLAEVAAAHGTLVAAVGAADEETCAPGGATWTTIDDDGAGHYAVHFPIRDAMAERWPDAHPAPESP